MIVSGTKKINNNLIALEINEYKLIQKKLDRKLDRSKLPFCLLMLVSRKFNFFLVGWHLEVVTNDQLSSAIFCSQASPTTTLTTYPANMQQQKNI